MYRGHSSVALNELFVVDTNNKGTRGHSCKLKKARCTRDIVNLFFFQIKLSTNGMTWIRVQWMHAVSMHLKSHQRRSGTIGWASLWISPLSPGPYWLMTG